MLAANGGAALSGTILLTVSASVQRADAARGLPASSEEQPQPGPGSTAQEASPAQAPSPADGASMAPTQIHWTVGTVFATLGVFVLAGVAEIGGGWLVWQGVRNDKPWYYILAGCAILVCYGFIPTLQPEGAAFARVYAVYGGVFIAMSYAWGWLLDGDRPDVGDWVGASIALAGVAVAWFWPRGS